MSERPAYDYYGMAERAQCLHSNVVAKGAGTKKWEGSVYLLVLCARGR